MKIVVNKVETTTETMKAKAEITQILTRFYLHDPSLAAMNGMASCIIALIRELDASEKKFREFINGKDRDEEFCIHGERRNPKDPCPDREL